MKALIKTTLVALLLVSPFARAAEVRMGDTLEVVRSNLGQPRGELARGDTQILVYERGEVELRNGRVSKIALRSAEEQAAYLAKLEEESERARQENEVRRARLITEGEALKARKLNDPAFHQSPGSVQVAFWQDFARAYPEVPIADLLLNARNRAAAEMAANREKQQHEQAIAELEERLAQAEAREMAGPSVVAPISYPYYPIYGRPHRPRHRDEPDHPVNFFPIQYPSHIGLGVSTPGLPPVGYDPLLRQAQSGPVIGYDPLLPRETRRSYERRGRNR